MIGSAPNIATVAANLLLVTATGEITNPNRVQPSSRITCASRRHAPGPSTALEDLQVVEQCLGANALHAVVTNLTVHALQADPPWIDAVAFRQFSLRFVQL